MKFVSSEPDAASIDPDGIATILANGSTAFIATLTPALDGGAPFIAPLTVGATTNLMPDCGDVDMGETSGPTFAAAKVGAEIVIQGRLNTCDAALGGFDVAISYDPTILTATGAVGDPALGGLVVADTQTTPGTVLINGTLSPLDGAKKGDQLPIFTITFTADAAGTSPLGGEVKQAVGLDGVTPIGTPGPVVAGDADLTVSL